MVFSALLPFLPCKSQIRCMASPCTFADGPLTELTDEGSQPCSTPEGQATNVVEPVSRISPPIYQPNTSAITPGM